MIFDNIGNVEQLLSSCRYCNLFFISILWTFLICMFLSHVHTKGCTNVLTMSYKVMVQAYSLSFDAKWDES